MNAVDLGRRGSRGSSSHQSSRAGGLSTDAMAGSMASPAAHMVREEVSRDVGQRGPVWGRLNLLPVVYQMWPLR